ncbi:MAG TPA: EscR/YscR/HrcR family type III secretion system export apparatus protein [Polyangia bacterium]|nr:EscR/YscR/HrcR family type III secretion system export apparatus protein [Polyangia bacterium]
MKDLGAWVTLLVAVPFAIVVASAFLKFAVVLAILRRALGGSALPPASVAAGLALLFALFVTAPVAQRVWDAAQAHAAQAPQGSARKGDATAAATATMAATATASTLEPVREFLARHAPARERQSFLELQRRLRPAAERAAVSDNDLVVLAPAFATAELKSAFEIGFLLFLPFLVIELLTAMVLTSLGMNTVAPEMVSLPFKLLLFVLADGWHLLFRGLILGYT